MELLFSPSLPPVSLSWAKIWIKFRDKAESRQSGWWAWVKRLLANIKGADTTFDHRVPWRLTLYGSATQGCRNFRQELTNNKLVYEGLECLSAQRVTDRPGLLLCHPWEGQNIILASLYFLVFPCGPITTAPSLSTGHSHSICLFYGSFSQEIQEARGNQNEVRVTSFGVRSKGASLSWVETVRFLALLSFLGSPGFHSSGHCLMVTAQVFCYMYAPLTQVPLVKQGWLWPCNVFWMSVLSCDEINI